MSFGRLVEDLQVPRVGDQGHEGADGLLRRRVGRDAGVVQDLDALAHGRAPEPGRQDGFAGLGGEQADLLGDGRRIRHGLGRDDDENGVDAGVAEDRLDRLGDELGLGVAEDVDRIPRGTRSAAGSR